MPVAAFQPTVRQRVLYGVESTPGTAVTADQELPDVMIDLAPEGTSSQQAANGSIVDTVIVPNKEWATGSISGVLGYPSLTPLLDSALGANTSGVWAPLPFAPITHKTMTVDRGTTASAFRYTGVYVNSLGLHFKRDGNTIDGDVVGQREAQGVTLAGSPTLLAERPVVPGSVSLWYADTFANLAASPTRLTSTGIGLSADVQFGNLLNPVWALDSAYASYAGTVEIKPTLTAKFVVQCNTASGDYSILPFTIAKWRAAQLIYMRIGATQTVGATTYTLNIDMALQILKPPKHSDLDGLYVAEWECGFVVDGTSGKWISISNLAV